MPELDPRLYLVTDRDLSRGRGTLEVVQAAVRGGVTLVQLRDKRADAGELADQARQLLAWLRPRGVPLIVNDRLDVALDAGADGVHLGQDDAPLAEARTRLGAGALIGVSVADEAQARQAAGGGADYLGVSPVWTTPTKPELQQAVELSGLRAIRRAVDLPLVGIGGINAGNAARVIRAGADGVAVVSALTMAEDVEAAARALRRAVDGAR
jgi:thiamine-phosphate pyrophosphorylase